jgi:hypothetical protein
MKHFVERVSNDEKLIRSLGQPQSVVEAPIEKAIFSIKLEYFCVIEWVCCIVVDELLVFGCCIHGLALRNETFF